MQHIPCSIRYFAAMLVLSLMPGILQAQEEYDEISVFVEIPRVGATEITSVISGNDLYLPVTDLFDFLRIRNIPDKDMTTISGFFVNQDATYTIDRNASNITYMGKVHELTDGDIIRTETNMYLRSEYFGKIFGLDCSFNFRNLSVTLTSKVELPIIREMKLEEMRKNLSRLKGDIKADTTIGRTYPGFRFGMADWSVYTTQTTIGKNQARLNLGLGAMVAGGEATANLYYNTDEGFSEKQQQYLWRYVNNDWKAVRQISAGKIYTNPISTIYNPVIGAQITNTPTTYRRSFGSYTLSDRTEPGWIVELYVNNVMVDFVKADASGFFTFQVPLVYGNSIVRLKFYGPWGEEKVREQNITIPFNFLPVNTLEYTASAGVVEDSVFSRYSKAVFNYGVTKSLTVGGGMEYLSSVSSGPAMPFVTTSVRVLNNLLLSGEFTWGVRAKGTFSYRLPSNIQLDLNYTWYEKDQKAILYNYREERKASLSLPLRIRKFSSYQRFTYYQYILPASRYSTAEWLFSAGIARVNTNITTYAVFLDNNKSNIYSNFSFAFRLPADFVLIPTAQVGYSQKEVISARIGLEKHLFEHGFMNLAYEQIFSNKIHLAEIGFRYDFAFAQAGATVRQAGKQTRFVEYARGSIINDSKTRYLGTDNRSNVGRGGITITPFLDLNANGNKDPGEPRAQGLNLHANGGRILKSEQDTIIRIIGLEPYTPCFIELDVNSFDNLSWRLPFKTLSVNVDPEILKNIEIPIQVAAEATGYVTLEKDGKSSGIGRIILGFYRHGNKPAGKAVTENDGYYSYLGLTPGTYSVRMDTTQLSRLGLKSEPDSIVFTVSESIDGEVIDNLDFKLTAIPQAVAGAVRPSRITDTTRMIIHEITREMVTIDKDSYAIQMGAFRMRGYAEKMKARIERILGQKLEIIIEDGFFKVRVPNLETRDDVDKILEVLKANGITEVWIVSLKAKKQLVILREREDTLVSIDELALPDPDAVGKLGVTVQLGAFRDKSNAMILLRQLKAKYGDRVVVIFDKGFYKLQLSGMSPVKKTVLEELDKLTPELGMVRFNDIWMKPPVAPAGAVYLEPEREIIIIHREDRAVAIPEFSQPVPKNELIPSMAEKQKFIPSVNIAIQVAVFNSKSEAMKAKRRIASKLGLNAEIVERWQMYYVLIRGFHSKEETYRYYPELAGIGYPGIRLIEE